MKLKGFGELPSDIEVVKGVENTEVGTEQAVTAEVTMAPQPKIDRPAKLALKEEPVAGPGDFTALDNHIQAAKDELAFEGNKNPNQEEIVGRLRAGVFSNMNEEELADRVTDALIADPVARKQIVDRINTGLKTEFVVSEAKREREEQDAKWEEVERVEAKIRAEREETARRTAQVLREAEEARRKETEEQDRKWEEVSRVREELEKARAEMSARTAAVIAAAKQKNSEWETPDGPRDVAA